MHCKLESKIRMASKTKTTTPPRSSRFLKELKVGKYADDADKLINIRELIKPNVSLREHEELDRELHIWRHQAELRDNWVPDVNDAQWRSWMFGTLLQLRRFVSITKPEERCQCKSRCLSNAQDHWPECQNGKDLKKKKDEEAEKARNRKLALAISKTLADEKVLSELTDDEVRDIHMRSMLERIKSCI